MSRTQTPAGGPISATDVPTQIATSYITEDQASREIEYDLQRKSFVQRYLIRGAPDTALLDPLLTDSLRPGGVHDWFPMIDQNDSPAYVTKMSLRWHSFGKNPVAGEDGTAGGLKDQGEAHAWSVLSVWFVQRACPASYEEEYTVSLGAFPEYYSFPISQEEQEFAAANGRPFTAEELKPKPLTGTVQSVPILRQIPIYKRRYIKVYLNPEQKRTLRRQAGKLNGFEFLGEVPGFWMLDGVNIRHLHGHIKDGVNAAYEVVLVFRGDPYRLHRYVRYRTTERGHIPINPRGKNVPVPPGGWTYENLHRFTKLYEQSLLDWDRSQADVDELMPTAGEQDATACLPDGVAI